MIQQLNPPLPLRTPKGNASAHFLIDYGIEHDVHWVCFQDSTGECWTWRNRDIRIQQNITEGRENISPFYNPEDVALNKEGGYFCQDCEGHNECLCDEEEDEENELEEKCKELEEFKLQVASEFKDKEYKLKQINELVLQSQELLLNCMRKKSFEKADFTNMFGWLRRTGMSESDVKTLTGMQFEKF